LCLLFLARGLSLGHSSRAAAPPRLGPGQHFEVPKPAPTEHPSNTRTSTRTTTRTPSPQSTAPTLTGTPPTATNTPCLSTGPWQTAQPVPTSIGRYAAVQDGKTMYTIGGFEG